MTDDAGPSSEPPPPFTDIEESTQLLVDVPSDEPPPPDFAPYDAEFFQVGDENIVSHDQHLNVDGEALYRFLLSQSLQAPHYQLNCQGTHTETRYRHVTRHNTSGSPQQDTESYTETITDFDFYIDIHPSLPCRSYPRNDSCGPIQWSVPDSEPAYRGRMVREVEFPLTGGKRTAKRVERKEYEGWRSERNAQGLPPWASSAYTSPTSQRDTVDEATTLKSSKTLRQWADEYCASPKHLKEFTYEKVLYGWNIRQLEQAVRTIIYTTPYGGNIDVSFKIKDSKVHVRPDNSLSRMLSNKWLKFLSIILLIFPFIWLFKRFHSRGGGRWEVCGAAYSLKREVYEEGKGKKMIGVKEGEWFRKWEGVIRRSVAGGYVSTTPITTPDGEADIRALVGYLDGY